MISEMVYQGNNVNVYVLVFSNSSKVIEPVDKRKDNISLEHRSLGKIIETRSDSNLHCDNIMIVTVAGNNQLAKHFVAVKEIG